MIAQTVNKVAIPFDLLVLVFIYIGLCNQSEFSCTEDSCIGYEKVCDGVIDCIYGNDELDCGRSFSVIQIMKKKMLLVYARKAVRNMCYLLMNINISIHTSRFAIG